MHQVTYVRTQIRAIDSLWNGELRLHGCEVGVALVVEKNVIVKCPLIVYVYHKHTTRRGGGGGDTGCGAVDLSGTSRPAQAEQHGHAWWLTRY